MSVLTTKRPITPTLTRREIDYPESDGNPVGETDVHIKCIFYLLQALEYFLRKEPRTYVAGNMMFYYVEGDPTAVRAPDIFVVKGVDRYDRRTFKLWEEGVAPSVVIEITSRGTRRDDTGAKKRLYESLGVHEYYLFDPLEEYLRPRLQGFRLIARRYRSMPSRKDGSLVSHVLGAILRPDGRLLRVVDPVSGEAVPTFDEAMTRMAAANRAQSTTEWTEAAATDAARAEAAEAEVARLKAELARRERAG